MTAKQTLLVAAAHPDDEVLGCGATVRRLVDQGWAAQLVLFTGGRPGGEGDLEAERRAASEVLGFSGCDAFDYPDNRLDTVGRMDLANALREVLVRERPSLLFTHHPGDYNWDHSRVFDAVMMAARASPGDPTPDEIWSFEVPSSTERAFQRAESAFCPNIYIDVADTFAHKARALACYASEIRDAPHPRSVAGVEALARKRGSEVGLDVAEAFALVRRIDRCVR